jgi:formylglycine-generating enzyme required for sulfatase activity
LRQREKAKAAYEASLAAAPQGKEAVQAKARLASLDTATPGDVFKDCAQCPEMAVIPAGQFVMGSPTSEAGRDSDEGPQRVVTIAQEFAAGRFEVTFGEWDACVRRVAAITGRTIKAGGAAISR